LADNARVAGVRLGLGQPTNPKSISYADPSQGGGSGIQVARVLEALGISEIMKPKTKLVPGAESVDLVAAGEAEFARPCEHTGFCCETRC
jgi:hypothetical protein